MNEYGGDTTEDLLTTFEHLSRWLERSHTFDPQRPEMVAELHEVRAEMRNRGIYSAKSA